MIKTSALLMAALLVMILSTIASASNKKGAFSVSPVIGGISFESDDNLETSPLFGVRLGYNFTDALGIEVLFDLSKTKSGVTDETVDYYRYGGELLYHFMTEEKFVPYLAAGAAGENFNKKVPGIKNDEIKEVFDYGLGAKYFVTDDVAWRVDVRHLFNSRHQEILYTVGLYIPFDSALQTVKLALPDPPPATNSPGLYVHVLDGMIDLSNQAGSQSVATGQFGYSPAINKTPILLHRNPGILFTPPPSISLTEKSEQIPVEGAAVKTPPE